MYNDFRSEQLENESGFHVRIKVDFGHKSAISIEKDVKFEMFRFSSETIHEQFKSKISKRDASNVNITHPNKSDCVRLM